MGMATIFAKTSLPAAFLAARLACAVTGLEWTTAGFAIWLLAFALALAVAAAAWVIRFIVHTSILA